MASAPAEGSALPGGPTARARVRRSLKASTVEGMFAEVVTATLGVTALTAWALYLNAGPLTLGVVGSLTVFSQFVQLPAAWVTTWFGRRRVAIVAVALARQANLPLVFLPFLPMSEDGKLTVLLVVAILSAMLAMVGNNAWVAWMGDLVPEAIRGRYFGRRTALCTLGATVAGLGAGALIDLGKRAGSAGIALAGLALLGCVAGALTTYVMTLQHEPKAPATRQRPSLSSVLEPLFNRDARALLAFQLAWNASVGFAAPFFTPHMVSNLGMGFALVALQAAGVALMKTLAVPFWGQAIDRLGARPVLAVCSYGITLIPLIWLFPTPTSLWPLALDMVVSGVLWSGHALATFSLPLAIAPAATRPFYVAVFLASGGLAFGLASAAAGVCAEFIPTNLLVFGHEMYGFQVLFLVSALGRLLSSSLARRIVEPKARSVEELWDLAVQGMAVAYQRATVRLVAVLVRR